MIVFDLDCRHGHRFEGWFRSHEDFAEQKDAGIISCPECGCEEVTKAFSPPNLGKYGKTPEPLSGLTASGDEAVPQALGAPDLPPHLEQELNAVFAKVRAHVESHCDYVGDEFAEEARRIHYGESDSRGIYGEATADETAELIEEGIEVMPLPPGGSQRSDA